MKPFNELTRRGQLRRLRQLAEESLKAYDLVDARLTFLHYKGNVIFRVDAKDSAIVVNRRTPYVPNRYILRILSISDRDKISSELNWLAVLRRKARLPVPEPIPTLSGELLISITTPGVPQGRVVTLMRWVDGRQLINGLRTKHVKAVGHLMAELHQFAADWHPPKGFKRFHWDWDGLIGKTVIGYPIDELISAMPEKYRKPVKEVSVKIRKAMESFGKDSDAYGMIHADMYLENVLFKGGNPRAIDFEDCGFGYWMYDIGVTMSEWWFKEEKEKLQEAFWTGYEQIRVLPESQVAELELFVAAQYAIMVLWSTAFIMHDPARQKDHEMWREKDGKKLLRCLNRC